MNEQIACHARVMPPPPAFWDLPEWTSCLPAVRSWASCMIPSLICYQVGYQSPYLSILWFLNCCDNHSKLILLYFYENSWLLVNRSLTVGRSLEVPSLPLTILISFPSLGMRLVCFISMTSTMLEYDIRANLNLSISACFSDRWHFLKCSSIRMATSLENALWIPFVDS